MIKKSRFTYEWPETKSAIASLIKRRRLQILVHSCLYYEMDTNIISDEVFDRWSNELVVLMKKYPNEYSDRFDIFFRNWDGSSGYDFPHRDPWVYNKAYRIRNVIS